MKRIILFIFFILIVFGILFSITKYQGYRSKKIEQQKEEKQILDVFNKINEGQVFLYNDASNEEIEKVRKELEKIEHIYDIRFISKEDALEEMKKTFKDDAYLLDEYEGDNNIFPVSYKFRVKIDKISDINKKNFDTIESNLKKIKNVDKISISIGYYLNIFENNGIKYLERYLKVRGIE